MFSRSLKAFIIFILSALIPLASITHAQQATPTIVEPTPEAMIPDNDLRSPRAAVTTFLSAMEPDSGEPNVERATKALDTSLLPELIRNERANEIAVKLYTILSYREITASKVPSSLSVGAVRIGDVDDLGIYLEQTGSNWRFSRTTVENVPEMFRKVEPNLSRRDMRRLGKTSATWLTIRSYIPENLKSTTFFIEDWHWVAAVATIILALVLHLLLVWLTRFSLYRLIPARFSIQPTKTLSSLKKPIFVVVFTSAVQLLLSMVDLEIDFYSAAITWLSTLRVLAFMVLAIRLIHLFSDRVNRIAAGKTSSADEILYPLMEKGAWVCTIVAGTAQILSIHGVNVSGLVAGLGLGGLAFALAGKDTVENIFGAVAILIDQPFRVGDTIVTGGIQGSVEHIGLRSTRLRTPENSLVAVPNSKIISAHVDNLGARASIRVKFFLNVSLSTPPASIEALCAGIRYLLKSNPACPDESIIVHLNDLTSSGLLILVQYNLSLQAWSEEQRKKEEVFLAILRLTHELQIPLAPPSQEIRVSQHTTGHDRPTVPSDSSAGVAAAKALKVQWSD